MDFLNYVNGQAVASQGQKFSEIFSIFNPEKHIGRSVQSDPMDFILALQGSKKSLVELKQLSISDRLLYVEKILKVLLEKLNYFSEEEAQFQGLSIQFMKDKVLKPFVDYHKQQLANKNYEELLKDRLASGIIVISASDIFCLKETLERILPAFIAGNVCIVRISETSAITANLLAELFNEVSFPTGAVQILIGSEELFEVMALHPSVAAVSFIGDSISSSPLLAKMAENYKKIQFQGSSKNSVIVLADFNFQKNMAQILEPLLMGMGRSYWNGARIFILESIREAFLESLKAYLQSLQPAIDCHSRDFYGPLFKSEILKLAKYASEIPSEHGKTITLDLNVQAPVFTVDLTNCSEKQQDSLKVPLFIISTVKYQHEIAKWVNTSYLAHSAVIFGSSEKAEKIAAQLDVGLVQMNQWQIVSGDCLLGLKNSTFGISDLKPEGSFFSGIKKLTLG